MPPSGATEPENYSPPWEGRCERIEGTPGTCPPSKEGGFQGGDWKSSPSLDSAGATPSSPPLAKVGRVREQRASARTHEFFHTFRRVGVGCCELKGPIPKATPSSPPQREFSGEPSMPAWPAPQSMKMGTTRNELDSPPREGCRGGSFQTARTHP